MTDPDDIESYWEGIRPPRDPETPHKCSFCDHIDPTRIEGYSTSKESLYLLEDPIDGEPTRDHLERECFIFKPPWYKLHRWFWWLFIVNGRFSSYIWTFTVIDGKIFKAYRRMQEPPL